MVMKARSNIKQVKNPFMKKEVPLISQELQDASQQNLNEAIQKVVPIRRRPPKGGRPMPGAVRG